MIEKCKIPLQLGTFTYADFTKDIDLAWEKLFKALKVSTPKPSSSTVSPVLHDASHWHLAHPYPMPPNFTGRLAEREILSKWLNDDKEHPLLILRALGGFGKSALTWHWLTHDVDLKQWPNVVFWSFYEGDLSFENFLKDTLEYLKIEVPQNQHQQVESLIEALKQPGTLLIMDGFERARRGYSGMGAPYQGDEEPNLSDKDRECVNINAEYFLQGICALLA